MTDMATQKPPQRTAAHRQLDAFAGTWRARGQSFGSLEQNPDDPRASPEMWLGEETYEWLPGGFFMLHRWDAKIGTHPFKGTEIIGYDEARGRFYTRMFDNAGNHPEYIATVPGNVWTFAAAATRAAVSISSAVHRLAPRGEGMYVAYEWLPRCVRHETLGSCGIGTHRKLA